MICPACNSEFASQNEYCENCGAPAYLAIAAQTNDPAYCTYCGARETPNNNYCLHCGLKKNFRSSEMAIGTCSNCGTLWRNIWLHCQTCGVPRENGLIQSPVPMSVPVYGTAAVPRNELPSNTYQAATSVLTQTTENNVSEIFSYDDGVVEDLATANFPSPMLTENEVVERMFVSQSSSGKSSYDKDVANFSGFHESSIQLESQSAAVVYDLHAHKKDEVLTVAKALTQSQSTATTTTQSEVEAAVNLTPAPVISFSTEFPSAPNLEELPLAALPTTPVSALTSPTPNTQDQATVTANTLVESTQNNGAAAGATASPVQAVKVLNKPRAGAPPPADKKLVRVILTLVALILLFAVLIVSGFRIRDLFSRSTTSQTPTSQSTTIAPVEQPVMLPQAPEGMVYIPGGIFTMGVDNGGYESPAHEVAVKPFFVDKTEVTNEMYAQFVQATKHVAPSHWSKGIFPKGEEKFPVVNVSWNDARDFAAWAGKRLPKEAEWEFAARSNTKRKFAWGDNWDSALANTQESNLNHAVAVGSYPSGASPFGVLDLMGNVTEWIDGEVMSYKDPNLSLNPGKVTRGGSFATPQARATATYRGYTTIDNQSPAFGFRCVKDLN